MTTALLEAPTSPDYDDFWADEAEESASSRDLSPLETLRSSVSIDDDARRTQFAELADELEIATAGLSSTRRASRHPAYGEILAMGDVAIPWLLERLEAPGARPLWLRLLGTLTSFQPGAGQETISESAKAWLRWGRTRGIR
ncbi:MAG: hypothetical protein JWO88_331 [Frankiales bacterium]|jgi:hypothetical protein|nr:hypothetical protein [Frankiales bacterium]